MRSYDALRVFPEIPSALELLEENGDSVEAHVFSNGTGEMVRNSIHTSPDLGPHAGRFKSLITVDEVKCFKPDSEAIIISSNRLEDERIQGTFGL